MVMVLRWSGYQLNQAQQTPEVVWGLRLLLAGIPLVALGVGGWSCASIPSEASA
ncbi:MAG: hypothetical protein NZ930_04905 [Candidatus Bipolaricaulota bacterium]|nr:hypothetical protein [Candidatus Bipolaricaulota bacterium]MDW8030367.1 hypothetical protein [Candidatus Bipolaricaulota bacterium]